MLESPVPIGILEYAEKYQGKAGIAHLSNL